MSMESPAVETLYESFVKPSTSTPPSLRSYKLSYTDQIAMSTYIPLLFFYPNPNPQASSSAITSTTEILEIGLSKSLSYYYPFAGRLRGNLFVECNDAGVHFVATQIKCTMTEFLQHPNPQVKNLLYHKCLFHVIGCKDHLMLVQLNYFNCSGMAVNICMSHKLGDASALSAFMHDWVAMVHQSNYIPSPQFVGATLFPPLNDPSSIKEVTIPPSEVPIRKFLFNAPQIAQLKGIAAKSGVKNPSRVEVVSALLYRCAMLSSMAFSGSFRPASLVQTMNLRPVAAQPKNSIGNIVSHFSIATNKEDEKTLPELVFQLRNAKVNAQNEFKKEVTAKGVPSFELSENLTNQIISNKTLDLYTCTSWCRIPFYDLDFGLGKPLLLHLYDWAAAMNHFTLMDSRSEGSIEAIIMLKDANHMSAFVINEELLAFASLIA